MQSLENDEVKEADEKFGKWWKSATWWKVWKVMKVDNLMKSLESDESWQPDEKFGKWWNSTTWWKVGKVMKSGKTLKKMQFASRSFFSTFFLYKRILPKSCSFEVTYFDKQKQQKNCLEKREWKWFEQATRLRGNFEPNNRTSPQYQQAILHRTILLFTFECFWVDHKSE